VDLGRVPRWRIPTGALSLARRPPGLLERGSFRLGPGPPTEFLTTSRPSDPSVGPTSLRFRRPTTTSPESAPSGTGVRPPRPGPARRFSQPLGGFLANPSLRPCFMPLPPLGHLSLQSFTSQESLHPSRGRLLPRGHPRASTRAARGLVAAGFTDAFPISGALAGIPPRRAANFQQASHGWLTSRSPSTARDGLAPSRTVHPPRSLDPPAKSALPTPRVSSQEQPCSPGIPPLQSLLHPFLGPYLTRHALGAQHLRLALARGPDAASGTSRPPRRVSPDDSRFKTTGRARRRIPAQCGPARAALRRRSFPHDLGPTRRRPRARPGPRGIGVNG
jgi:hypothetical protein